MPLPTPSAEMVKPGSMAVTSISALRSLNDFSRSILVLSLMLTIAEVFSFLMLTVTRSPLRETMVPVTLAFLPASNFFVGVAARAKLAIRRMSAGR